MLRLWQYGAVAAAGGALGRGRSTSAQADQSRDMDARALVLVDLLPKHRLNPGGTRVVGAVAVIAGVVWVPSMLAKARIHMTWPAAAAVDHEAGACRLKLRDAAKGLSLTVCCLGCKL